MIKIVKIGDNETLIRYGVTDNDLNPADYEDAILSAALKTECKRVAVISCFTLAQEMFITNKLVHEFGCECFRQGSTAYFLSYPPEKIIARIYSAYNYLMRKERARNEHEQKKGKVC